MKTEPTELSPENIDQFCDWVASNTIQQPHLIPEAYIKDTTEYYHMAYAATGYIPKEIPELTKYLYAALGYPIKQTWIRAINQGHCLGWPGLTVDRGVNKHLSPCLETAMGRMHKTKQGT